MSFFGNNHLIPKKVNRNSPQQRQPTRGNSTVHNNRNKCDEVIAHQSLFDLSSDWCVSNNNTTDGGSCSNSNE